MNLSISFALYHNWNKVFLMTFNRRNCGVIPTTTALILTKHKFNCTCQKTESLCQDMRSFRPVEQLIRGQARKPRAIIILCSAKTSKNMFDQDSTFFAFSPLPRSGICPVAPSQLSHAQTIS